MNAMTFAPLLKSVVQVGKPLLIIAEGIKGEAPATQLSTNRAVG